MLKLAYLTVDYWAGYWFRLRWSLRQGHLVLFDRYFDDYTIDPKRFRLPATLVPMARTLLRLLPEPDLYVLLDVAAKELQRRKAEVAFEESVRQRSEYLHRFEAIRNAVIVDAYRTPEEVCDAVTLAILSFHRGTKQPRDT